MKEELLSRRSLLKTTALSSIALVTTKAVANCRPPTPEQTSGPFYPIEDQADKDSNLIQIRGRSAQAKGQKIKINGRVLDANCQPVAAATVEIWQACATGKYSHPADPNPAKLDPDFQYWGKVTTNKKGEYSFLTIKPGTYPATPTWKRPPHIHFRVSLRGFEELTTQMYFADEPLNSTDKILQAHGPEEQKKLVIPFLGKKIQKGKFDLTLKAIN